ncbi:MAG: transposase family protein [Campylobacterota bacterium]|nr:transposase family protein [Campylobacterota bacterium]
MSTKLLKIFKEELSEQARDQGRQYSIPVIMYLSVLAILMGAKNPIEIYSWMKNNAKRKEIKKLLGVEFFKPIGKSRLYEFFEIVDKDELEIAFRKWISTFIDIPEHSVLAVDGKVLRGSANSNESAVSVLSAVLADYKLIIAHKEINKKSNEIPALQELIGELDETFTYEFDALNTQKKL